MWSLKHFPKKKRLIGLIIRLRYLLSLMSIFSTCNHLVIFFFMQTECLIWPNTASLQMQSSYTSLRICMGFINESASVRTYPAAFSSFPVFQQDWNCIISHNSRSGLWTGICWKKLTLRRDKEINIKYRMFQNSQSCTTYWIFFFLTPTLLTASKPVVLSVA